jgi:hypothetical protein
MKTADQLAEALKAATAKRGGMSGMGRFMGLIASATPAELAGWTVPEIRAAINADTDTSRRFVLLAARQAKLVRLPDGSSAYGRGLGEIHLRAAQ